MPFSYEALKAREMIDEEFTNNISINAILEQGKFNDYLMTKYFQYIKNNDEFDKIVNNSL
jgi:hypothetical protein